MVANNDMPPGLDAEQVREIIQCYGSSTEEEWIAEFKAADDGTGNTVMIVPTELMPTIRAIISRHEAENPAETAST